MGFLRLSRVGLQMILHCKKSITNHGDLLTSKLCVAFDNMSYMYCLGKKILKVLMQDSALLHGVIAYAITHYHAG